MIDDCGFVKQNSAPSIRNPQSAIKKMDVDFPYHYDSRGRTAEAGGDDHIRDLIEAVLFTAPGERVNRPTFGSGLLQLVFAPNSDELAVATQFLVQGSLQQWLGDLIEVNDVRVGSEDSRLEVTVVYTVRRTQEQQAAQFTRAGFGQ
jgi:phage baseplate assembly protein W